MLKIMFTETEQRLLNAAMEIMGPYGELQENSKWAVMNGKFEWAYRFSVQELIIRGTSEIMRTIIAERGLKLPRS